MNIRGERKGTSTVASARIGARARTSARIRVAAAAGAAVLAVGVAWTALAGDTPPPAGSPAPAPAPSLAVSDKAPPGCCCIVTDPASGSPPRCSYGLSEDKCRTAGHALPQWDATWTPGKCSRPEPAVKQPTPR